MSLIIILVGLVLFFYLVSRLNAVEAKLNRLEKGLPAVHEQTGKGPFTSAPAPAPGFVPTPPAPDTQMSPQVPPAPTYVAGKSESSILTNNKSHEGLEFQFGGKFFTIVGSVAVLLGIGFFLRYAFEQNLITETMRVVLGVISGGVLIALGDYLRTKYAQYGEILQGTGSGVLYLSFFSAYSYYGLITQSMAFAIMIGITVLTVLVSLRSSSQALAGVAMFGAYLTPFLTGIVKEGPHELFSYIFVVNIGALLLAMYRGWRGITLGALFGTALTYVSWHSSSFNASIWATSFVYLTLFFLTFLSANIYRYFIQKHKSDENDLALVIFNPMFYFVAGSAVLQALNQDYIGWFAFALSALYLGIGYWIREDNMDAKAFHSGVSTVLFFIGVPLAFDKQWITIAWAAQGLFILRYALSKYWRGLEFLGHAVLMIASARFLIAEVWHSQGEYWIFNGRALTFALVAGMLAYAAYASYRSNNSSQPSSAAPNRNDKGFEVLLFQIQVLALFWTAVEITDFGNTAFIGIVWSLLALALLSVGVLTKNFEIRAVAYITAILAVIRILVFDSELSQSGVMTFLNFRVLSFVGTALVLGLMLWKLNSRRQDLRDDERKAVPTMMFFVMNLLLLWVMSLEISNYFDRKSAGTSLDARISLENTKRVGLSVAWSLYAALMLVVGIAWKLTSARLMSISLFAIVIFKVFLYDTANLPDFHRFVSFLTLGIVLLVAGYLYNRYKARIEEFIKAD